MILRGLLIALAATALALLLTAGIGNFLDARARLATTPPACSTPAAGEGG